jgi:GT2 family glycosyltransferase
VDNASVDGSREWLESFKEKTADATVHFNEVADGGFAEGVNTGLSYCTGKYVLLLNNDTLLFQKDWLTRLAAEMANPKVAVAGAKLIYPNGLIQHAGVSFAYDALSRIMRPYHIGRMFRRDRPEFNVAREVPAVTFACALIRRSLLKDGLDTAYKRGCYEDTDFCLKVRKQGHKIMYVPTELYHYEGATNLEKPSSEWYGQVQRNYELFLQRWGTWLTKDFNENNGLYDPRGPVKPVT